MNIPIRDRTKTSALSSSDGDAILLMENNMQKSTYINFYHGPNFKMPVHDFCFLVPQGSHWRMVTQNISDTSRNYGNSENIPLSPSMNTVFIEENQMRPEMKIDHWDRCVLIENLLL